jgi:hypothetical protein
MRPIKIKRDEPIEVGSVVKYKNYDNKTLVGEVLMIYGFNNTKAEVMLYDKRLQPAYRSDGSMIRRRIELSRCKHLDPDFKFDTTNDFHPGDVVCRVGGLRKRYGVIVGFRHPDEIVSTTTSGCYNGTDLIQCVEINKRGLDVKRGSTGDVKRFECLGKRLKQCDVDLWNRSGPKITIKK